MAAEEITQQARTPTIPKGDGESFADLFEESLQFVDWSPGSLVTGVVMNVDKEWVTIHVGLKSEGIVPIEQFKEGADHELPKIGDEVEVVLETMDDGLGYTLLSREKARRAEIWRALEQAMQNDANVKGVIKNKVKGGFIVDVGLVHCFLPGSLVDVQPIKDISHLEGKELEFKILRLEAERNNVVLSRRAALSAESSKERATLLASLEEGQVHQGIVKNLTDYGAFVDLGGVDGLLHVTDMSWKRVNNPSDVVSVGDKLTVKVLKYDSESQRISLGLKQLQDDPWESIQERYPAGSVITARVTKLIEYGCFAEVESGIEGLIHISEMSWIEQNRHPSRVVQIGDEVQVKVLDVNAERHRISLSIKQCQSNPWEKFAAEHGKGDRLRGTIKSITDFGLFVQLESGLTGLVHVSDIANDDNENNETVLRNFKKNEDIDVVLLSVDVERERIAMIIQDKNDPLALYLAQHPIDSKIEGEVVKLAQNQALVKIEGGVKGVLRASEASRDPVEDLREAMENGARIKAKIIGVNYKDKQVVLSIKQLAEEEEKEMLDNYQTRAVAEHSATSLGDLIQDHNEKNKSSSEDDSETEPAEKAKVEPVAKTEAEPAAKEPDSEAESAEKAKVEPAAKVEAEPATKAETEPAAETESGAKAEANSKESDS